MSPLSTTLQAVHRWGPVCLAMLVAVVISASAQIGSDKYSYGSDSLESRTQDGRRTTILRGHARLQGEGLTVTGDVAFHYGWLRRFLVQGNVYVVSDSLKLWADSLRIYEEEDAGEAMGSVRLESVDGAIGMSQRAFYRRGVDQMSLMGNAQVIDGEFVVKGDSILLDRPRDRMEAFGHVKIVDEASATVVDGERAVFDRELGVAIVDSVPRLTSRRQGPEVTTVTGDWMSFRQDGQWSRAVGEVVFQQGPTSAHADTATFLGDDVLVLTGSPQVEQQHRQMMGDEIRFQYENQVLRRIDVFGQAKLVDSTPDTLAQDFASIPLQNILTGDSLRIYIDDGAIQRTHVVGNASSTYLPEDQTASVSVNEVAGDDIDIEFGGMRVQRVQVDGSVTGTYRFLERSAIADSAAADSVAVAVEPRAAAPPDSVATVPTQASPRLVDFETSADRVTYTGDKVVFWVEDGRIDIRGHGKVEHGTLGLAAGQIQFDTVHRELYADEDPLLTDKDSELVGDRMGYLFDAQTGAVGEGATKFDDGYYTGQHIRRVDKKTLLVEDGTYTSCDLAEPHYHFSAKRMKLKIGEQVVARQVTFHLNDIPLLTLPFYYKSLDSGRHSGILFPNVNLGVSSREGRFIRDLGYYWATNDYTDFRFELDYNERNDATFTIDNRYTVRYGMSGGARFDYLRRFSRTQTGDEWKFNANHRQPNLLDAWSATASVRLSSSTITNNNLSSDNRNELIDTQLHSTGALSRTFDNGMSLNVSALRDQFVNAEDDDQVGTNNVLYRQTLPRVTLGVKTRPLLGPVVGSAEGNLFGNVLRDIQFSQSYGGEAGREEREESRAEDVSLNGRWGLSYAPKGRLGPFVATSSASFGESYLRRDFQQNVYELRQFVDPVDSTVTETVELAERIDETTEETRPSLSISNSLRSDLYGIFDTDMGAVRGIKHKVSWSVSHNWRPQLGSKQERSQDFSFNLTNEVSLKIRDSSRGETSTRSPRDEIAPGQDESSERTRKLDQFLRWSLSTSYDPDAPIDRRWSTITSSVLIRPGVTQAITFDLNQSMDPYTFELLSTRVETGLRLQGNLDLGGRLREVEQPKNILLERLPAAPVDSTAEQAEAPDDDYYEYGDPRENPWLETGENRNAIPWTFNTRASISRTNDPFLGQSTTRATVTTNASVRLPGQWQMSYSAGFDVERGEFTNQFWSLRRDIHEWTLEFNRGVTDGSDFGFRLYLRDIPDLEMKRGQRNAGDMLGRLNQF